MRQPPDASTARCTWCDASRSAPRSSTPAPASAATAISASARRPRTSGAIDQLADGDYLFASYRDHGSALAVGSDPTAVMAELFGKSTGVAGGYGGSMHLLDVERRFYGGWGIVGGHLPIAVGAALALDSDRDAPASSSASSATARPTSAPSTRPSTSRRSGTCRSSSRSSTTSTAWGRPSRRPPPSPSCSAAPPPTGCTASASTATISPPCARPRAGCCARRATSAGPRSSSA